MAKIVIFGSKTVIFGSKTVIFDSKSLKNTDFPIKNTSKTPQNRPTDDSPDPPTRENQNARGLGNAKRTRGGRGIACCL
jgi:hypothetical protein